MKREEILKKLTADVQFPRHGWIEDDNRSVYLVFPILRATYERAEASPEAPLLVRDFVRMGHFQRLLFKIIVVLTEINRAEQLLLSDKDKDGASIEEFVPVLHAQELLPIWIDCFYIYFRMLADRLTVALGSLASKAPRSFPERYKVLWNDAISDKVPDYKWKIDGNAFMLNVKQHSDWYKALVGMESEKGIRDRIIHTLTEPQVIRVLDKDSRTRKIEVHLEGDAIVPKTDLLLSISNVLEGFCKFLSLLPREIWQERKFMMRDLCMTETVTSPTVKRFFPII